MPASSPLRSLVPTAWLIVVLLWPVALLNYLDRQMLASMKFSVMADIVSIENDENWGWMLGQFKWVYAFLSPIGGYVADRFSRRYTICASLFVWSAVTWWTGQVSTFNELLLARSLMGISEAFYIPAALALISDHHLGRTRSRAVAVHQMAIYCGVILGGFGGYVADAPDLGWRVAFTAAGVFGMLYAVPLVFLLRDPPMLEAGEEAPTVSPITAARDLFTNTSFILLVLYFTLPALAGWIIRDWMPAILKVRFQIGQGKAGVSATLFWQSAAIVGAIVGGWLADRWMQRTQCGRINVSAIGMVLLVPALLGVGIADTLGLAIAFLILFGIGWGFFDCNNMPILCQIVRPELRATGYGIMNMVSISCGGGADWAFGAMRVRGISDAVIFTILGAASVVSIALVLMIRPKRDL